VQATYTAIHRTLKKVAIKDKKTVRIDVLVGDDKPVHDIRVNVDIEHTWVGDLTLKVSSPSGAKAILQNQTGGSQKNLKLTYDMAMAPELNNFVGTTPQGKWTLEVKDNAPRDTGEIVSFGLELDL
jgi:subtilisin-like proprotein convertase family protein